MRLYGIDNRLQPGALVTIPKLSDDTPVDYIIISRARRSSFFVITARQNENTSIIPMDLANQTPEEETHYLLITYVRQLSREELMTHWHPIVRKLLHHRTKFKPSMFKITWQIP